MNDDLITTETGNTTSTEDNKMMASFRIDRELWAKFGKLVKSERLTATDVLTDYIQRCTDDGKSQYAINPSNYKVVSTDSYDTDKLNDTVRMMVNAAIEASLQSSVQIIIESALEPITDRVKEVKSFTQSQLQAVRNEFEKALSDRIVSIEYPEKLAEKTIGDSPAERLRQRVNIPPIETSIDKQDKAIENTIKSPNPDRDNNVDPDRKPISKGIRRWLEPLKNNDFRGIIQAGISEKWSNQEIVTKLFEAGYGKDSNNKPYPADLASAMKTALRSMQESHIDLVTSKP